MIFKLKCKKCGNVIFYDSDANHEMYQKCGKMRRNNESFIALEKILTDYFNSSH